MKRPNIITFHVSDQELREIKYKSERDKRTIASYVRIKVFGEEGL